LLRHPLCAECAAGVPFTDGTVVVRVTPATVVDHIRDHKGDLTLFWDPKNHRAVCRKHHDQRVDAGDFGRSA
jgi:5-methylcytosine-specific restriction protein A